MAGRRGAQQRGRTDDIRPEKTVYPRLPLAPGDAERPMYEALLAKMGVSGTEVLREGLRTLHAQQFGDTAPLKEAS
ncbi:hypothetical protein [Streptomyces sp. NPDC047525]|uniref:hypothetical protein n=1 Tax=Streptomyces sp. NPDC047525 TaxID=3155264 RepID=UPI0033F73BAB